MNNFQDWKPVVFNERKKLLKKLLLKKKNFR